MIQVAIAHKRILLAALVGLFVCPVAGAQVVRDSVAELMGIDIIEHLGDSLPLNLSFVDDNGIKVTLSDYFKGDKPVLLTLGYYECPMLCNLVFNGVSEGIKELGWVPGEKYQVISVSIDPLETAELAANKKANYIKFLEMPGASGGWHFLVTESENAKTLADAIGFEYYYVEDRDEYAHAAAAYLISPDGVISRYLYGIQYTAINLKLGLLEASEGKIGSTMDKILLYCYRYDPDAKGYVLFAQNAMKVGGAVTVVLIALLVGSLFIKERLKAQREVAAALENNKTSESYS
ncbi:MAG: SCO family protein [candidate division Zixibacteria bacterium]|nr:SCO family protein [candidate division Zixibacteria bacterium]